MDHRREKKIAVVFEGRDTAGKTGSISVLSKYLIPKHCRLVKLGIPTAKESKNWFQRYEKHLPDVGELVFLIDLGIPELWLNQPWVIAQRDNINLL